MYLTGFADEASHDLEVQIKATKELGWKYIESRNVWSGNMHEISDEDFEKAYAMLQESGIRVNCFGSEIANWKRSVTDPFEQTVDEVKRAIVRMKRLDTKLIRIMSYKLIPDCGPEEQMAEERFRRLREIHKMFTDEGITPVHENCMNFGGMGWKYTMQLVENVPGLKLVFDTGNPVFTDDRSKEKPYPKQSAREFWDNVKDHVAYIHIKDGFWNVETGKTDYTFAGEGNGDVKYIVKDALDNGYEGGISMEPHLKVVFHDENVQAEDDVKYENYVEYGKRFMNLVKELGHGDKINSTDPV